MAASFHVLAAGYVGERVASTVSVALDEDQIVIVDPGMVGDRSEILGPLADLGIEPGDVTDVIFSHHHPDHTLQAALFPQARFHDHWAIYRGDLWDSRPAEGFDVSPHVKLIETPGHTPQDITTLIETDEGVVACTHLWWHAAGPAEDPFATDPDAVHIGRARVLSLATLIVPGHGEPFQPDEHTPR
jgi:glyoxylase-like metal-dependent hydrolase (beta-lactamase superfamily II)